MVGKTDNSDLAAKLHLRRHFLQKYHADGEAQVLDCCSGDGVIWRRLRREFKIATYWGVDLKAKKGRLRMDSVRILRQPGWPQDVVDVDTYGSPWKHFDAILGALQRPTTVFLTVGQWQMGTDQVILDALGLGGLSVPPGIAVKLHGIAVSYLLTRGCVNGIIAIEAVEAVSTGMARYLGVRLERAERGPEK